MPPKIEYLPDACIDAAVDREIRGLLTTCFTGPQDAVFQTRRYFNEPYPHRWIIRDERGALGAHVGVHDKLARAADRDFRFGGIAEVSVRPDCRGRGYVRDTLAVVHEWLARNGFVFSILFGKPEVYGSSGYLAKTNALCSPAAGEAPEHLERVLVKELAGVSWPEGDVTLQGLKF